ncbi:MAG: transporter substrate-binding domain-containing protein [Proteobacteria bacterium]|nr:transporter substrate-binding domain-containing protein [Pseudomonadota bacterium]
MKVATRLIGLVMILVCISACGESATEDQAEAAGETPAVQVGESSSVELVVAEAVDLPEEEALPEVYSMIEARTGDLDIMKEHRTIRVLTVYSVGRYYLDGPAEKGLVYEMFKRFENDLNKNLKTKHIRTHLVFIPVARNQLIPALLEGRGDIVAAGLSITPERQELVDFTDPVSKPVTEIFVTGPAAEKLASIDDLSGKTVHVRESSSYRESLDDLNQRFLSEGKAPVVIEPISELLEDDDLIEMVNSGLLPWAIVDSYKTQLWDGVFKNLVVRDDIVFRSGARIAWAFRKGSPKLEATLNKFVKKNRQGTLIGNVLTNRYVRDFDWAANALDKDHYARFQELEGIFQAYGEQYGVNYLIAAAQGYQESQLDQKVRSGAGAVGVMQLLPSTAAGSSVGIKNIDQVDPNIHAGIKYLDYLRTRYFSELEDDKLNQTLLALAAYNAGPSRMINMRRKAKNAGYDPDVWFDNVEMIAAKDIGAETVQYVANIYKYYIAYRLTAEQESRRDAARKKAGI